MLLCHFTQPYDYDYCEFFGRCLRISYDNVPASRLCQYMDGQTINADVGAVFLTLLRVEFQCQIKSLQLLEISSHNVSLSWAKFEYDETVKATQYETSTTGRKWFVNSALHLHGLGSFHK